MNFVSMSDSKYYDTISFSVSQSLKFYPDRNFYIYDWGFDAGQVSKISSIPGVNIINWRNRLIDAEYAVPNKKTIKNFIKRYFLWHPDQRISTARWQREFLLDEKCYCMLDMAIKNDGSFLFLDADAFIVNRIDEFESMGADIVVTLRPRQQIEDAKKRGSRHDINSGVIYFGPDQSKTIAFIIEWVKEMGILNIRRHPLSEQTALSNIILKADKAAFTASSGNVKIPIGDLIINCKIVSTIHYNFNEVENGFDPELNKILHLKSGRGTKLRLDDIVKKLDT